ncbi:MAG: hypothetical protein Q9200_002388 [Gallowayella weberi]
MKSLSLTPVLLVFVNLASCITNFQNANSSAVGSVNNPVPVPELEPVSSQDILNLASDVFAIQIVGSKSTWGQLNKLCTHFNPTRLVGQGYNESRIHNIFCEATDATARNEYNVPSSDYIQVTATKYSSYIWIFQAVGALKNDRARLKQLCESIDVGSLFEAGQEGGLVKNTICDAANGIALPKVPSLPVPFAEFKRLIQGPYDGTPDGGEVETAIFPTH